MSRKGGGQDQPHRKVKIVYGNTGKNLPAYSIQCFEQRHGDCHGEVGFTPEECECKCHVSIPAGSEEKGEK